MGTNYYAHANVCSQCGRSDERRHVGKSSAGWCFSLHVYPEDDLNTLDDWRREWHGRILRDEYSKDVDVADMLRTITERSWSQTERAAPFGYPSWQEFHRLNHSQPGPNGLVRHAIDGRHCIGHGAGTWDYCVGDFS